MTEDSRELKVKWFRMFWEARKENVLFEVPGLFFLFVCFVTFLVRTVVFTCFKDKLGIWERKYDDEKDGPLIFVVYNNPGLKNGHKYSDSGVFFSPQDTASFTVLNGQNSWE